MSPLRRAGGMLPAALAHDAMQVLEADADGQAWRWRISVHAAQAPESRIALPPAECRLVPLDAAVDWQSPGLRDRRGCARLGVLRVPDGAEWLDLFVEDEATRMLCLALRPPFEGTLLARPLLDHMMLPAASGRWRVLVLSGRVQVSVDDDRLELEPGEAAWLDTGAARRGLLEGHGELALANLLPSG